MPAPVVPTFKGGNAELDLAKASKLDPMTWGVHDRRIADTAERDDAVMATMEARARAGDIAGCEAAARFEQSKRENMVAIAPRIGGICAKLARVSSTHRRLERARSR